MKAKASSGGVAKRVMGERPKMKDNSVRGEEISKVAYGGGLSAECVENS